MKKSPIAIGIILCLIFAGCSFHSAKIETGKKLDESKIIYVQVAGTSIYYNLSSAIVLLIYFPFATNPTLLVTTVGLTFFIKKTWSDSPLIPIG